MKRDLGQIKERGAAGSDSSHSDSEGADAPQRSSSLEGSVQSMCCWLLHADCLYGAAGWGPP